MAAEDHLSFADQQVGEAEDLMVLLWTLEVFLIHFLQALQEVTEAS